MSEPYIAVISPDGGRPVERATPWVEARQALYDALEHTNINVDVVNDGDSSLFDFLIRLHEQGQALQSDGGYTMEAVPQEDLIHEEGYPRLFYILRGGSNDVPIAFSKNDQGAWVAKFAGGQLEDIVDEDPSDAIS